MYVNHVCKFHTCNQIYPKLKINHSFHSMLEFSSHVFTTFEQENLILPMVSHQATSMPHEKRYERMIW